MFEKAPYLNDDAIILLRFGGGIDAFEKVYGDYYVAGYNIGADTGLMCGESAQANSTVEKLSVKVEVTALLYTDTYTDSKFFSTAGESSSFSLAGFDTLSDLHVLENSMGGGGLNSLRQKATSLSAMADQLTSRVQAKLRNFGLYEKQALSFEMCEKICESGLVVELILLPINKLRDVVKWTKTDDVI